VSADVQKRAAALAALELVDERTFVIGLGTGSTAEHFVRGMPQRLEAAGLANRTFVATSEATAALARDVGLTVVELDLVGALDLTVDGADEVGPQLALIKGAGGALLREKLVWEASRRCVVIADASKRVSLLGRRYPLPIEVVRFGHATTARRIVDGLADCGVAATLQLRLAGDRPFVTDNGNYIYDAPCGAILDPAGVEAALKSITGVVDHGLFLGLAERALVATDDGVVTLLR